MALACVGDAMLSATGREYPIFWGLVFTKRFSLIKTRFTPPGPRRAARQGGGKRGVVTLTDTGSGAWRTESSRTLRVRETERVERGGGGRTEHGRKQMHTLACGRSQRYRTLRRHAAGKLDEDAIKQNAQARWKVSQGVSAVGGHTGSPSSLGHPGPVPGHLVLPH